MHAVSKKDLKEMDVDETISASGMSWSLFDKSSTFTLDGMKFRKESVEGKWGYRWTRIE